MDYLDGNSPSLYELLHVSHIAVACAHDYLDLRFKREWRKGCPRLVKWLDAFAAKVPAFELTKVT